MALQTSKVILLVLSVTLLAQVTLGINKVENDNKVALREYVDINGTSYFIDTFSGYYRDEAKTMCESLNMTMVTFETDEKWMDVMSWLETSQLDTNWFWTSALRDVDSTVWYWETSGENIAEFHWKLGQPSLDEDLADKTCINFSFVSGGWDDDKCTKYYLDAMCENI